MYQHEIHIHNLLQYRIFPSGGTGGYPHELYVPPQSLKIVPPPIFVDHDKKCFRYFQSLHGKG